MRRLFTVARLPLILSVTKYIPAYLSIQGIFDSERGSPVYPARTSSTCRPVYLSCLKHQTRHHAHALILQIALFYAARTMASVITMADAEPDVGTNDHISPPRFIFLLPPGVWSMCQAGPFRFLDLPPELRNRIYEQAFTGFHGLSPHHLTQVNSQIRAESAQMFRDETNTFQVTLQTPKQMTCFLNWIEDGAVGLTDVSPNFEFTYTDIDVGITIVRFEQVYHYPKLVYEMLRINLPGSSAEDVRLYAWHYFMGLHYQYLLDDFSELVVLHPPPSLFIDAVENGFAWTYYKMQFISEPLFPATSSRAQQFFLHFMRLLTKMSNENWSRKALRDITGFLFMRSMQAGMKVKNKV